MLNNSALVIVDARTLVTVKIDLPKEYLPARHHAIRLDSYSRHMDAEEFRKDRFLKDLGQNIAKIRKSKGYSQDRVCLEAGLSRGALSKIESGRVEPKVSTLALIAITIDVPLGKLIGIDIR